MLVSIMIISLCSVSTPPPATMIPEGVGGFLENHAQCLCQGWGFIHRFVYHLLTLYLGVSHSLAAVSVLPPPALPDPSLLWGLSRLLHRGGWEWGVGDAPYVLALQQYHQISLYQQWPLFGPCWSRDGRKVKWRELMETSMHLKSSAYTRTHFMG